MNQSDREKIDRLFNPRGLALFGGLTSPGSFGHLILLAQIRYGFQGGLYPISKQGGEISGLKVYTDLGQVPGPVDLAAISVPARAVPNILESCLAHGLAGAQIHSSGFAETGSQEGHILQEELIRIAARGLRIVGPNCFGLASPRGGITVLPGSDFSREPGPLAMISQSGGVATDFGYEARRCGIGLSKVVSFGNGCDLEAAELMEYLAGDQDTGIIAAYIEGVRDGRRFLEAVRQAALVKPVVIWKAGLTPLGRRAARSHTGSLAGQAEIWAGALTQAGAVMVQGLDEMMDALAGIHYLRRRGRRLALMGGGGAIGVFCADLIHRGGLELPTFSPETQAELQKIYQNPGSCLANPLDTGSPIMPTPVVEALVRESLNREPVDVIVLIFLLRSLEVELRVFMDMIGHPWPPPGAYFDEMLDVILRVRAQTHKDVVVVLDNRAYLSRETHVEALARDLRQKYQSAGVPVYPNTERALRGLRLAAPFHPKGD